MINKEVSRHMTAEQFKKARVTLGLSQDDLAILLRLGPNGKRTVRRWETGEVPVPGPVSLAVEALLSGWRPKSETEAPQFPNEGGETNSPDVEKDE